MAVFPCDHPTANCDCADDQISRNFSSERADPFTFFSLRFFAGQPPLNAPPDDYVTPNGVGGCYAATQQQADDCALRDVQERVWAPWRSPSAIYANTAQTCLIPCANGAPPSEYTVPAGTFLAHSQAEADALAASYCRNRGTPLQECLLPPSAITGDASNLTGTTATLNGTVNPNGVSTIAYFEWGTTTAYGHVTPIGGVGDGIAPVAFSAPVTGLTPGTYHFRIVGTSSTGTADGADKTFTLVAICATPGFWDLGIISGGQANQNGIASLGGKTINLDGNSNLNYFDGAVLNNAINTFRLASTAGATITQTAFIITSDINFFVPGDVNKFFEWTTLGLRYQILQYLSATQVRVDTSNTVGTNRNSASAGITGTQTLNIVTASGPFFLPSDVGATLTWNTTLDSQTITAYISPTQVQTAGSTSEAIQTFSVVLFEDGAVEFYSVTGVLQTARVNANGDIVTSQDDGTLRLIRYKPAFPGQPFVLTTGTSVGRINSAGNILGTNSQYYYANGTSVAVGFVPALFIGSISGRDTARFVAQNSDKLLEGTRNFTLGQNLRIWENGVLTNLTFSPMPPAPHLGANQTLTGHCMSPNGSCICDALGFDAVSGTNQNFYFILDPSGYSQQLSAPPGTGPGSINALRCINDSKIGVGSIRQAVGFGPIIIAASGVVSTVPYFGGNLFGESLSVNAGGTVVGYQTIGGVNTAFIYKGGIVHNLNDYLDGSFKALGWYLSIADVITDDGYILGRGKISGVDASFLMCSSSFV